MREAPPERGLSLAVSSQAGVLSADGSRPLMTILDPISGTQVTINTSGRPAAIRTACSEPGEGALLVLGGQIVGDHHVDDLPARIDFEDHLKHRILGIYPEEAEVSGSP